MDSEGGVLGMNIVCLNVVYKKILKALGSRDIKLKRI